jgi:transposase
MMTRSITNEKKRQRVFALREKGLSYAKIAKAVDVSVPTVGIWVRSAGMISSKKEKDKRPSAPGLTELLNRRKEVFYLLDDLRTALDAIIVKL